MQPQQTLNSSDEYQRRNEALAQAFYSSGRYNPVFLAVTALGFIVIYLLTRFNVLGQNTYQLLFIAGSIGLAAVLQIPAVNLARAGKGVNAYLMGSLSIIILAILLTVFWEGIAPVVTVVIFVTPLIAIRSGLPRRSILPMALLVLGGLVGIWFANGYPFLDRLATDSTPAITSLAFLGTTGLLLFTVTVIAQSRSYRSLRLQLLTSFVIIVTIPTVLATVLSAVGAYVNNQNQLLNVLATVSNLKEQQVDQVVNNYKIDVERISRELSTSQTALRLLAGDTGEATIDVYRTFARSRLQSYLNTNTPAEEIMMLNLLGDVVISSNPEREGRNYQSELFYREGSISTYAGFSENPNFRDSNLVFSTPLYDTDGTVVRGILVLRTRASLVKDIIEQTPTFPELEAYLLDRDYFPVTRTRVLTQVVRTQASESLLGPAPIREGRGTYEGYTGDIVLGYYQQLESLNLAFIAEVPRSYLIASSLNSLLGSASLAFFAIIIAIGAVAISSASITEPISALARTAESFATGEFAIRANLNRQDEIGALGRTYDQMAGQLQDTIGRLEQRVSDRTRELEDQTGRLRAAAEVARDAASSHNLTELLSKAGNLIQERFGFYHTGIFLLDNNGEYAVLTASPTQAGKQMIANGHKLRVGEVGIVGRVASNGEPRISLDTGADAVYFDNPFLPNTRSEMALPLKSEGRIIGVLDVQSEKPQAFGKEDIAIMQILADLLATAIERTNLLQQSEETLKDLERAYGQFTREGWRSLSDSGLLSKAGYRFDNVRIQAISDVPDLGTQAMETGVSIVRANSNGSQLITNAGKVAIPIKLRGQTIGVVSATLKDGYTQNTINTLELAIERLALSLESARLYEEARLRADREQTIAQIASSITATTEFDAILRTTVEEVGRVLGDSEVSIQIVDNQDTV